MRAHARSKKLLPVVGGIGVALALREAIGYAREADLDGQVALITGGTRGLGLALAGAIMRGRITETDAGGIRMPDRRNGLRGWNEIVEPTDRRGAEAEFRNRYHATTLRSHGVRAVGVWTCRVIARCSVISVPAGSKMSSTVPPATAVSRVVST